MFRLALRNVLRSRTRSLLTVFGVAGSIAMCVSLSAISRELKQQLDDTMSICNIDVVVQEKGSATPTASRITTRDVQALGDIPEVASVSSVIVGSVRVPEMAYMFLFGVSSEAPYLSASDWMGTGLIEGRTLGKGVNEVLLGKRAALRLHLGVGDTLLVGEKEPYRVAGIYWFGLGVLDGGAIVDIDHSQALLKREGFVNLALIQGRDRSATAHLVREIRTRFPELSAQPANTFRGQIRAISMIDGFVTSVSVISLVLGGVIILNTLLMAISERTREIGVLMAVGWSTGMIMRLIIFEALLLGLIGGFVGYLLSFPILGLMTTLPAVGPGWVPATPAAVQLAHALGLSVLVAGVSALYPAVFATRLLPATALRYE